VLLTILLGYPAIMSLRASIKRASLKAAVAASPKAGR